MKILSCVRSIRGRQCKDEQERRHDLSKSIEPEMNEFISALAAGMSAQLIVEVSTEASKSTIALAAAARQTGGRLVCILPEPDTLEESKEAIEESGLLDMVEFMVGDPYKLLPKYENIDFSLVDCKMESNKGLLSVLDVNPNRAVVVANHLEGCWEGLYREVKAHKGKRGEVRTMKHPIGNRLEVTVIGEGDGFRRVIPTNKQRPSKSRWVMKVDEESGEEHIFRVPQSH
ncbi:hypothetical protein Taro_040373 [Colocasia esculenta]|uniref:Uncharacterized protein n=1 Tax=Colocasia esculenta TaxID=4460 RepID=A0A843WIJ9_COLES|nr:hypothetical protein [Colocasia esculenta]